MVYTHADVEVVKSGSEDVMRVSVGDVIEEDGGIQVLFPPVTQEKTHLPVTQGNTHARRNGGPDEILSC